MDYRIFVSHKQEDEEKAKAVTSALGQFSGDLTFFISGESIAEGEDWRVRLRSELRESNLLLLLFTEPTRNWDWCLYEAGLFTQLDRADEDQPIVCIYGPDSDPPSPLVSYQGVTANVEDMSRFISRLVKTTEITRRERPLNANVTDGQIAAAAAAICDHFSEGLEPYYACYRVHLELPAAVADWAVIPPESTITASEGTLRIFGRTLGTETWGELVESHAEDDARWLGEINRVFADVCAGRLSPPTTYTFRAHDGARIFRPELYRIDRKGRSPVAAVVIFTEEVTPSKVGGSVFNRLRIAERYRTEVFGRLDTADPTKESSLAELLEAFRLIRDEAKALDVFEEETLRASFPDDDVLARLREIGEQWGTAVAELFAAEESADTDGLVRSFRRLDDFNDRYRAIVARRYAELLDAGVDPPEP